MVKGGSSSDREAARHLPPGQLSTLLKVSGALASSLELEDVLQTAIESTVEVLGLETGAIYLLDGEDLHLEATTPPLPQQFPGELRHARLRNHPHIARAVEADAPIYLEDAEGADLSDQEREVVETRKLRSLLYLPVSGDSEPIGAMILGTTSGSRHFSDEDIDLSRTLSYQVALAVVNARLFDSLRKANEELGVHRNQLEQRVQERTRALQSANEELDHTNEELQATNEELETALSDLSAANDELSDATRAKSKFLAAMSHELRTPLNSVIGFSGVLLQDLAGPLNDEQRLQIGMINDAGKHLLALIEDVLDLAKVEAGRIDLSLKAMDANELVREVVESVRPLADERSLKLESQLADRVCIIHSDPGRLRQILLNLLGNAIKFTEAGTVSVRVGITPDERVTIAVSDTGPGIDGRDVERIFGAFTQLDGGDGAKPAGTGLGLALSQEYAALLSGEITVESELGVGSTFSLLLPLSHRA